MIMIMIYHNDPLPVEAVLCNGFPGTCCVTQPELNVAQLVGVDIKGDCYSIGRVCAYYDSVGIFTPMFVFTGSLIGVATYTTFSPLLLPLVLEECTKK